MSTLHNVQRYFAQLRQKSAVAIETEAQKELRDLELMVGPVTSHLTADFARDAYQKQTAREYGFVGGLIAAMVSVTLDFESTLKPIQDPAFYANLVGEAKKELDRVAQQLRGTTLVDAITRRLPAELKTKLGGQEQLFAELVQDHAVAVVDMLRNKVSDVQKAESPRERALGMSRLEAISRSTLELIRGGSTRDLAALSSI